MAIWSLDSMVKSRMIWSMEACAIELQSVRAAASSRGPIPNALMLVAIHLFAIRFMTSSRSGVTYSDLFNAPKFYRLRQNSISKVLTIVTPSPANGIRTPKMAT